MTHDMLPADYRLPVDTKRKYAIINALSRLEKPSIEDLHRETDIPLPSLKRQISAIRSELQIKILFVRESEGQRGGYGYYMMVGWGILDRDAFLEHFGRL